MAHRKIGTEISEPISKGSKIEWAKLDLENVQKILGKTSSKIFRTDHLDFGLKD